MVALKVTDTEFIVKLNAVDRIASAFTYHDIHLPLASISDVFVTRRPIPAVTGDVKIPAWKTWSRGGGGPSGLGTLMRYRLDDADGWCFVAVWLNRPALVVEATNTEYTRLVLGKPSAQTLAEQLRVAALRAGAVLAQPSRGEQRIHKQDRADYDHPRHLTEDP